MTRLVRAFAIAMAPCACLLVAAAETTAHARSAAAATELFAAAQSGDAALVEKLLESGVDLEARDESDRTPLIVAAVNGRLEIVRLFLSKGADINARNKHGMTALSGAAGRGRAEIVSFLIAKGVDVNKASEDVVAETPLFTAAASGSVATVDALLKGGAQINLQSRQGKTALMSAAMNGASDTVVHLLENGADPDIKDSSNKTALHYVVGRCLSADAIQVVIDRTKHTQQDLTSVLFNAAVGPPPGCPGAIKVLAGKGANVDWQGGTPSNDTALILASLWGRQGVVEELLALGADVTLRNKQGQSAADVASTESIRTLLKAAERKQ